MFDTKFTIVLRDDLAPWQELNVTAFLASGIVSQHPDIIGEPYQDGAGNTYNALSIQPVVVMSADAAQMHKIHVKSLERGITTSLYIEEMFSTGHDVANRDVFSKFAPESANVVGIAIRAEKKIVDKLVKGAKLHK
ncbi:hypothetical protein CES85_0819 [Ochrobactrum quorumnocens]|uniref:DUF2000 family protein n=1 Tax=Ochrobactrum quorumnocens TaxID=271865 RepID=A0A248UGC4_9HYPH|nr:MULTISPECIES: DUF2000 family protein [Brucella/Ochrobactrum group]ASV85600.1 hypothetical protein CES85_0819 [[Ochrobactrum] quorumnocens]MDH7791817.1 hypothetical protein [Ochrobactrum sp. AN78]